MLFRFFPVVYGFIVTTKEIAGTVYNRIVNLLIVMNMGNHFIIWVFDMKFLTSGTEKTAQAIFNVLTACVLQYALFTAVRYNIPTAIRAERRAVIFDD